MLPEVTEVLTANEEQLVIDLASDYSERMVAGEPVAMTDYLSKLPSEPTREVFTTLANMSRLISTIQNIHSDDIAAGRELAIIPTKITGI
jgi:hypothetical protein